MSILKQVGILVTLALTTRLAGQASSPEFRIDAAHSSIEFDIPFMYSHVHGRFDDVRGTVLLPDSGEHGVGRGAAMAVVRVGSINTGSAHRDEHLRSSDFFDVGRFPLIVFRSKALVGSLDAFTLRGSLTMHGVTREIEIPCRLALQPVHDLHHVILAEVDGAVMLARRDFGILGGDAHNPWFDRVRSRTMGDSVRVTLEIHLWTPDATDPDSATTATIGRIDSLGIDSAVSRLRAAYTRDSTGFASAQPFLDGVGQVLLERRRVRDAFLWLHALARLLPASADAMVSVGTANAMMNDTTRAGIWYRQALMADSLSTRAYVRSFLLGAHAD